MDPQPRLLSDLQRPRGMIKADYTDFVVDELPLYPADGAGTHTYFLVEKAGLTTAQAVHDIAVKLGVRRHDIGYAGLKDSRAVTRQWMSIEHVLPERVAAIEMPRLRILETTCHGNKLKIGHLRGNQFHIKVRGHFDDQLALIQDGLATLVRRGVPNYYGPQRFGYRGDSWRIGRAMLLGQTEEAIDLMLGAPTEHDHGDVRKARKFYEKGDFEKALHAWPRLFINERRMLGAILRSGGKKRKAIYALDKWTKAFFVSAYQSVLFNRIVAQRLPTGLDRLLPGDLAWLHANGAVFHVEDLGREQPRCDAFDISPTGPLFGYRCTEPTDEPLAMEQAVLESEGLTRDAFRNGPVRTKGGRRPLRFPVHDGKAELGADEHGSYVALQFVLPRGCYATAVLTELFELALGTDDEDPAVDDLAE